MRTALLAIVLATFTAAPALAAERAISCLGDEENRGTDVIILNDVERTWTLVQVFEDKRATAVFTHGESGPLECSGDADMCKQLGAGAHIAETTVELDENHAQLTLRNNNNGVFSIALDLNTAVAISGGEEVQCQEGYPEGYE
jgi:hypothetical protein